MQLGRPLGHQPRQLLHLNLCVRQRMRHALTRADRGEFDTCRSLATPPPPYFSAMLTPKNPCLPISCHSSVDFSPANDLLK